MATVFEIAERLNNGEVVEMMPKWVDTFTTQLVVHEVKLRGDAVNIILPKNKLGQNTHFGLAKLQLEIFKDKG